jgi:hypothetical protein
MEWQQSTFMVAAALAEVAVLTGKVRKVHVDAGQNSACLPA